MDYTFSTQPVTMPTQALEHTFWTEISRKGTEYNQHQNEHMKL